MYSSTLYLTFAIDWGGWSTPRPGCWTPGKDPVPNVKRLCGPQGRAWRVRIISPPPGFDLWIFHPIACRYTDWTVPVPTRVVFRWNVWGIAKRNNGIAGGVLYCGIVVRSWGTGWLLIVVTRRRKVQRSLHQFFLKKNDSHTCFDVIVSNVRIIYTEFHKNRTIYA